MQSTKHAHKRALVLTARKLVRLVDALLRTDTLYRTPAQRQDRQEGTTPTARRPGHSRRSRQAAAVD